jgi:sugar phosphate isomerase/epimerase
MARTDFEGGGLMRLGLSSAAAADASFGDLAAACALRGLSDIELRAGDGHGIDAGAGAAAAVSAVLAAAAATGVRIAGYRSDDAAAEPAQLARLSEALGSCILVADEGEITDRIARAGRIRKHGGRSLVLARGPAGDWRDAIAGAGADYGWEIDAGRTDLAADADIVLREEGPAVRYIRFSGGGPEASLQEGRGIGTLMGRLALAGYTGPIILAPSSTRYRVAWASWLGRRGGWGCGSRAADPELVHLSARAVTGGA